MCDSSMTVNHTPSITVCSTSVTFGGLSLIAIITLLRVHNDYWQSAASICPFFAIYLLSILIGYVQVVKQLFISL